MTSNNRYELIVKTRNALTTQPTLKTNLRAFSNNLLTEFLNLGITLQPIAKPQNLKDFAPDFHETEKSSFEIYKYFKVNAPEERLFELLDKLNQTEEIEAAYIKPPTEPAFIQLNNMRPTAISAPPAITPSYRSRQTYLDSSPVGVDAQHAWNLPG